MKVAVISAGFQSTVQDCGRLGARQDGVASGGALDSIALRLLNLLVGNPENAAGLEFGQGVLRLHFDDHRLVAWTGAECEFLVAGSAIPPRHCARVPAESLVEIKPRTGGRAWLAISGGIDVPQILGSRATDLRASFGGYHGRSLRDGDAFSLGPESPLTRKMTAHTPTAFSSWSAPAFTKSGNTLRVTAGSEWQEWDEIARERFLRSRFRVALNSDRMGLRLKGPALPSLSRQLVSEAVAPGTIQYPPDGAPILLLADCQTIGGYPKIAHVITVDLSCAAQLQPLDEVGFEMITLENARALLLERERQISRFRIGLDARFA